MKKKEQLLADLEKAKSQLQYAVEQDEKDFVQGKIDKIQKQIDDIKEEDKPKAEKPKKATEKKATEKKATEENCDDIEKTSEKAKKYGYDLDELIKTTKERSDKAKMAAEKRKNAPKKTPATKNKEAIEKTSERITKNVEKRAEKGNASKEEIEKLIAKYEQAISELKAILSKMGGKARGGYVQYAKGGGVEGEIQWWEVKLKMPNGEVVYTDVIADNKEDAKYYGEMSDYGDDGGKVLSVKFKGVEKYAKGGGVDGEDVIVSDLETLNTIAKKYYLSFDKKFKYYTGNAYNNSKGEKLPHYFTLDNRVFELKYFDGSFNPFLVELNPKDLVYRKDTNEPAFKNYPNPKWNTDKYYVKYAKGGGLSKYKYVPNRSINSVEVSRYGRDKDIDGADILDGIYVKKGKYAKGGDVIMQGYF